MEQRYTKIATCQYSAEAAILRGKLEAEGIRVFMADTYTIDVDPLISNAIGGVKLFVETEDATRAIEVLRDVSLYSVDDEGHILECPGCGAATVEVMSTIRDLKSLLAFLFSFGTLPFYTKYKYHCNSCGHEFNIR